MSPRWIEWETLVMGGETEELGLVQQGGFKHTLTAAFPVSKRRSSQSLHRATLLEDKRKNSYIVRREFQIWYQEKFFTNEQ